MSLTLHDQNGLSLEREQIRHEYFGNGCCRPFEDEVQSRISSEGWGNQPDLACFAPAQHWPCDSDETTNHIRYDWCFRRRVAGSVLGRRGISKIGLINWTIRANPLILEWLTTAVPQISMTDLLSLWRQTSLIVKYKGHVDGHKMYNSTLYLPSDLNVSCRVLTFVRVVCCTVSIQLLNCVHTCMLCIVYCIV